MGVQGLGTINIYKGEFTLTFACPKIYSNVEAPTMNMSSTYCLRSKFEFCPALREPVSDSTSSFNRTVLVKVIFQLVIIPGRSPTPPWHSQPKKKLIRHPVYNCIFTVHFRAVFNNCKIMLKMPARCLEVIVGLHPLLH